ncbi:MAG: co-chaperone GroES [Candidatus Magasanikbacteria bacterium]
MNVKPLSNNVVIKPIEEEDEGENKTEAGILIPDTAEDEDRPSEGEVQAVGPGKLDDSGERISPDVKVGDKVLFNEGYSPTKFKSERGEEFVIVEEGKIIGIIEE